MEKQMIPVDDNLGEMLNWAVRYALGRRTYAVSDTCAYIIPLVPYLDERTICCMQRDIIEQESLGYGDACDKEQWMRLLIVLNTTIKDRNLKQWR